MKQSFLVVAAVVAATFSLSAKNPDSTTTANSGGELTIEQLPEVVVTPVMTQERYYGRRSNSGPMVIKVEGENGAGKELGFKFKIKKSTWVKQVSFAVVSNDSMLTRMSFRLNLYKKLDGENQANNLVASTDFLYTKEAIDDRRFTFTLPELWAIDKGEYLIAIEFCEDFPNRTFMMPSNIMTGTTLYRPSPQQQWQKIPLGSTLAVKVVEEN